MLRENIAGAYFFRGAVLAPEIASALGLTFTTTKNCSANFFGDRRVAMSSRSHAPNNPGSMLIGSSFLVAFDGRIDNRKDLCSALGLSNRVSSRISDVELALRHYQNSGVDCFSSWIGDYAVAIWDGGKSELILARDPFGVKPIYYHIDRDRIVWSSCIEDLLCCPDVRTEIDEQYVLGYLLASAESSHSPFKDIHPVPPGHVVRICEDKIPISSFWSATVHLTSLRSDIDAQDEERFCELFSDAIRSRLQSDGPIVAELSGGLDSSLIIRVADWLKHSGLDVPQLFTLSFVFDQAKSADERKYIELVEAERNTPGIHLLEDADPVLGHWADHGFISHPSPLFCFGSRTDQVLDVMKRVGSHVLLSGWAGDQLLLAEGDPVFIGDLFGQLKWFACLRNLWEWSSQEDMSLFVAFWRLCIHPNLKRGWSDAIVCPRWIAVSRENALNLYPALCPMPIELRLASQRMRYISLLFTIYHTASGIRDYPSRTTRLDIRYPFLHRPLVEFLLSTPMERLIAPGQTRAFQRRVARRFLPEQICVRVGKVGPDEAIFRGFARSWKTVCDLHRSARASRFPFIDMRFLMDDLEAIRHGRPTQIQPLLRFISLEMWLRNLEDWRRPRAATPNPSQHMVTCQA